MSIQQREDSKVSLKEQEDFIHVQPKVKIEKIETQNKDLSQELAHTNQLINKCRALEKFILERSEEPIYSYPIGFESEDDEQGNESIEKLKLQEKVNWSEVKEE